MASSGKRSYTVFNSAPVANNDDEAETRPGDPVEVYVLGNDTDPDADPLSIIAVGPAANGTTEDRGSYILYYPNGGFVGTDSFTYTITDGVATSTATATVTVFNSAPVVP